MRSGDGSSAWIKAMTIGHDQMATTIGNGDESIFMRPGDGSSAWIKAMTIGHGQMATAIVNGDESINILVKVVLLEACGGEAEAPLVSPVPLSRRCGGLLFLA